MKRALLHISFWIACLLEGTLLVLFRITPLLSDIPQEYYPAASMLSALLYMLPKLLFSYFLVLYSIPKMIRQKKPPFPEILQLSIVFGFCIILYRLISVYIAWPFLYKDTSHSHTLLHPMEIFVAIMDIGFVSALLAAIHLVSTHRIARQREISLVKEKLEAELRFLRKQTSPDFLMNTLNNIYALAEKKSDDTPEVIMKLSELLHIMLYESGGAFITLAEEFNVLQRYLDLEKIRYHNRLSISFTKKTDNDSYRISPLLLLPLVENAFTHGISETRFESFIMIDITVKEGVLHFIAKNTKEAHRGNTGRKNTGLINVKRQLELSYKDFQLDIINGNTIFTVDLSINLNSHTDL